MWITTSIIIALILFWLVTAYIFTKVLIELNNIDKTHNWKTDPILVLIGIFWPITVPFMFLKFTFWDK